MILLTKLRGGTFVINCDLIETVSEKPDTTILLTNGDIYIVQETMQEVKIGRASCRDRVFITV